MNCPVCGLLNPPNASRCDCGYDFGAKAGGVPVSFWRRYRFLFVIVAPIAALVSFAWLISLLHE
jgi:hypothetical protein